MEMAARPMHSTMVQTSAVCLHYMVSFDTILMQLHGNTSGLFPTKKSNGFEVQVPGNYPSLIAAAGGMQGGFWSERRLASKREWGSPAGTLDCSVAVGGAKK